MKPFGVPVSSDIAVVVKQTSFTETTMSLWPLGHQTQLTFKGWFFIVNSADISRGINRHKAWHEGHRVLNLKYQAALFETPSCILFKINLHELNFKIVCYLIWDLLKKLKAQESLFNLKSVHFKKPVTRISFLSKVLSFLLKSKQSQRKWQHFWKKWGLRNCLLKMNGLYMIIILEVIKIA